MNSLSSRPSPRDSSQTGVEARRHARFREAFAKIAQNPTDGPEAPSADTEKPAEARAAVGQLSFEAWMAGKSIRPPGDRREMGPPLR